MDKHPKLETDIGKITLKNPVMTASGTFGYGREFADLIDLNRLGAIIVKGLSLEPAKGNPPPRIVETPCGMLNAIGLENIGIDAFEEKKLPFLKELETPVFVNIYGKSVDEYGELAARIDEIDGVAGIEVNISCPNVKTGGIAFGVEPKTARSVVKTVRKKTAKPVIVKLSPNVTDITEIAKAAEGAGADSLSVINTITGMAIDIETRRPKIANITGGLSGPAIRPVALRMVWQTAGAVKIPVIGVGGIMTADDAIEFFIAGASAIQVGTANLANPTATVEILDGIEQYMARKGVSSMREIIGTLDTSGPQTGKCRIAESAGFEDLSDIFEFAVQKAAESAEFYETASDGELPPKAKQIFLDIAQKKKDHGKMLEDLAAGIEKDKYKWMRDLKRTDFFVDIRYQQGMVCGDILALAAKIEAKTLKLYNELSKQVGPGDLKKKFQVLAREEAKSKLEIETMVDDYSGKSGKWGME